MLFVLYFVLMKDSAAVYCLTGFLSDSYKINRHRQKETDGDKQ